MEIPKILDYGDYDNYPSDPNPTTNADIMNYLRNQNKLLQAMAAYVWQPLTNFVGGQTIFSPNMPAGFYAVVTKAGKTSANEPSWSLSSINYTDNSVGWRLCHISSVYSVDGVQADANGAIITPLMVGATSSQAGKAGRVPAPEAGMQEYILTGEGIYKKATELKSVSAALNQKADKTDIEKSLAQKADKNKLSMPSSYSINIAKTVTSYTAPVDGWLYIKYKRIKYGYYGGVTITIGSNAFINYEVDSASGNQAETAWVYLPVAANQETSITKSTDTTEIVEIRFDYSESER